MHQLKHRNTQRHIGRPFSSTIYKEMDLQSVWLWISIVLLVITAYWYLTVPSNLPPGSAGVPILGYLPFLSPHVFRTFANLVKKYGNIYYVYIGSNMVVVINDFATIKKTFVEHGEAFNGRFNDADLEKMDPRLHESIMFAEGKHWYQHRKFILRNLRHNGVGKAAIEPQILDEINHFVNRIRDKNGVAIDFQEYLGPSVANTIHLLITGQRFTYDHPTMTAMMNSLKHFTLAITIWPLTTFFPWAKHIIAKVYPKRSQMMKRGHEMMLKTINDAMSDVRSKYVDGQNDNFLYAYLTERNTRLQFNNNKEDNIFTESGLILNTRDLLIAGSESTTLTISWAFLYMALHPDVQKRVQREIDDVIGRHREPSYADRINTPYTEATINELHRVISLVPLGIPFRAIRDTTLFGYSIPKDTGVFANLWAVHHDVTLWGDPENFRPERFIGPKGECLKPEYLIPFGIGKRTCAGEPLARMELYLYFVSLLQHFDFVAPEGVKLTPFGTPGFVRQPTSRTLCVKPRSI